MLWELISTYNNDDDCHLNVDIIVILMNSFCKIFAVEMHRFLLL